MCVFQHGDTYLLILRGCGLSSERNGPAGTGTGMSLSHVVEVQEGPVHVEQIISTIGQI